MPPFWISTSWDDGHVLDQRLAELLSKHQLTGTFYIAHDFIDQRLSEAQIIDLSAQHEIGAHTMTHPSLSQVPLAAAQKEIIDSKEWLQAVIKQPITAFCYPRGDYNPAVQKVVVNAGFETARTVEGYQLMATDRFALPTTLQVYPFPLRPVNSVRARFERLAQISPHLARLHLSPLALTRWPRLAAALLARAAVTGGVWHLWGHSWEIERYAMWDQLAQVLKLAGQYVHDGRAQAVTNTQLARALFDPSTTAQAVQSVEYAQ